MNRFNQIILMILALGFLAPAQAAFYIDGGSNLCQVFAADDEGDGKKKDGETGEEKEEEEPDCDE